MNNLVLSPIRYQSFGFNMNIIGVRNAVDRLVNSEYHSTSFRLKQLALSVLSFAGMYGVKTALDEGYVSCPFVAIALGTAALFPALVAIEMRDLENPRDLSSIRDSAQRSSLENTLFEHGWKDVFKYFILGPEEFRKQYESYVGKMSLADVINTYKAADRGLIEAKIGEAYEIPSPIIWKEKLYQETGGDFAAIIDRYNLEDLISTGLISSDEFFQSFEDFFERSSFVQVVEYSRKFLNALHSSSLVPSTKEKFNLENIEGTKLSDRIKMKFLFEIKDQSLEFISKEYQKIFSSPRKSNLIDPKLFKLINDSSVVVLDKDRQEETINRLHAGKVELIKIKLNLAKNEQLEKYNQEHNHLKSEYQAGRVGFFDYYFKESEIMNRYNFGIKNHILEFEVNKHTIDLIRDQEMNRLNDRAKTLLDPFNETLREMRSMV